MAVWQFPVNEGSQPICLILISTWDAWCSFNYVYGIEQTFNYFQVIGIFKIISQFIEEYFSLCPHMENWNMMLGKGLLWLCLMFGFTVECWGIIAWCLHAVTWKVLMTPKHYALNLLYIIYWQLVCQLAIDRNLWNPPPHFFWLLYAYFLLLQQCKNVHNTQ